jgi:hypothetical protein
MEGGRMISKEKLVQYLKESKINTSDIDNDNMYLYATGRNMLADLLLVGIYLGDFDDKPYDDIQNRAQITEMFDKI